MAAFGLTGTYKKDKTRSDSQERLYDKLEVGWLIKQAAGMLATLKFDDKEQELKVTVKAGGIFDSTETYSYGKEVINKRRDKKPGELKGTAMRQDTGKVQIKSYWAEPHPGSAVETYILDPVDDELHIDSELTFADGEKINFKYASHFPDVSTVHVTLTKSTLLQILNV